MDFIDNIILNNITKDQIVELIEKIKQYKRFKFLYVFTNCKGLHFILKKQNLEIK